jgi:hypothetical protein
MESTLDRFESKKKILDDILDKALLELPDLKAKRFNGLTSNMNPSNDSFQINILNQHSMKLEKPTSWFMISHRKDLPHHCIFIGQRNMIEIMSIQGKLNGEIPISGLLYDLGIFAGPHLILAYTSGRIEIFDIFGRRISRYDTSLPLDHVTIVTEKGKSSSSFNNDGY